MAGLYYEPSVSDSEWDGWLACTTSLQFQILSGIVAMAGRYYEPSVSDSEWDSWLVCTTSLQSQILSGMVG